MDCEIRPLSPEEHGRHGELISQAFEGGRVASPPAAGKPAPGPDAVKGAYGLFEGRTALAAAFTLLDYHVHWGPTQTLPLGGIAGVATFVEARGKGYVGALMRHSLEIMRGRGQVLSALYPFAFAFYRRFGWDWVGERRQVTLPLRELHASPEGKHVVSLSAEEARETLKPVYTANARRYRGVFDAESHQWEGLLAVRDGRRAYVYIHQPADGEPDGYMVWRYPGRGEVGRVSEFVANSPEAYRGLLSVLHYAATQLSKASVSLAADDPLWSYLMHWDLETKVVPVFMARVVDVPAALAALRPSPGTPEGRAVLALRDEHAPWNEGNWRVEHAGGSITCTPAPGATPDLACDIQAFSQAFWGYPSLSWLRRAGRLETWNEPSVQFLDRLLSGPPVWTLDDF